MAQNMNQPIDGDFGDQNGAGQQFKRAKQDPMINVNKPNPYVIVQEEDGNEREVDNGGEQFSASQGAAGQKKNYVFKYPKAKIFVGGLDFKLETHDLMQHFSQFGEIENAVILKDTYTK